MSPPEICNFVMTQNVPLLLAKSEIKSNKQQTTQKHKQQRQDLSTCDWIQSTVIELSDYNILVASIYNQRHTKLLKDYISFISGMARIEGKQLIILGDLNAHHQLWHCRSTNQDGRLLAQAINQTSMQVYNVPKPTRLVVAQPPSVIDLAIGTIPNLRAVPILLLDGAAGWKLWSLHSTTISINA